jgi:hypothetical protein
VAADRKSAILGTNEHTTTPYLFRAPAAFSGPARGVLREDGLARRFPPPPLPVRKIETKGRVFLAAPRTRAVTALPEPSPHSLELAGHHAAMPEPRRFPSPWSVEQPDPKLDRQCFIVPRRERAGGGWDADLRRILGSSNFGWRPGGVLRYGYRGDYPVMSEPKAMCSKTQMLLDSTFNYSPKPIPQSTNSSHGFFGLLLSWIGLSKSADNRRLTAGMLGNSGFDFNNRPVAASSVPSRSPAAIPRVHQPKLPSENMKLGSVTRSFQDLVNVSSQAVQHHFARNQRRPGG